MKKFIVGCLFLLMFSTSASAFLYDLQMLTKEEIKGLKDEQLVEIYIDAKIEITASRIFHGRSGFNPKEYVKHKKLLMFIVNLRQEMKARGVEAPPIDEWVR